MKIALVSTGLGRVLRGFETFTESLFQSLMEHVPEVDVTLFQGGGRSGRKRQVIPNFHRYDPPARWMGYEKGNLIEKRSFALALYPLLRKGKYDIVHYNELVMGSALHHLRRYFGGTFKLLYCGGSTWSPAHYGHRCDFAQLLTGPQYEEALNYGLPRERLFMIPYGFEEERFSPETRRSRDSVRCEIRIPPDAKVILTVAMIDRETKRIDYLIRELSSLKEPVWLVVAGQRGEEADSLEREGMLLLGGRLRFISWPPERIPLLYGAADIFVLPSIVEAFGRVIIEALLTGLPAVIHNGAIFRWVAEGTAAALIDMGREGSLKRELETIIGQGNRPAFRERAVERFGWNALIPRYLEMYQKASEL